MEDARGEHERKKGRKEGRKEGKNERRGRVCRLVREDESWYPKPLGAREAAERREKTVWRQVKWDEGRRRRKR